MFIRRYGITIHYNLCIIYRFRNGYETLPQAFEYYSLKLTVACGSFSDEVAPKRSIETFSNSVGDPLTIQLT